jgi:hypothetical protein
MRLHGIHHLVVMDANRPVGIVSDRDLGGRRGSAVRSSRLVADLMTEPVLTVGMCDGWPNRGGDRRARRPGHVHHDRRLRGGFLFKKRRVLGAQT